MSTVLEGRCACGATTWKSTAIPSHLDFCYCTLCQQVTGAPFGPWTGIEKEKIVWSGPIATYSVVDFATRSMCTGCGATLTIQYHCYPHKTHVAAGTIVNGAELMPKVGVHLWVKSKQVWYDIPNDGLPRWDGFDDEFAEILGAWETERDREGKQGATKQ